MAAEDSGSQSEFPPGKPPQLSRDEAIQLTVAIANMTSVGLPLASGLRALAEETPGTSLAVALNQLADRIASGVPFDQAIATLEQQFPPHLRGLISVGLRTGELGETLADFAERERALRARRRRIYQALAYPVVLFVCSLPVLLFTVFILIPHMSILYEDFGLTLPDFTVFVFDAIEGLTLAVGVIFALIAIVAISGRWLLKIPGLDRLYRAIPLLGPVFLWARVANFSQVLGTLVKHHVPLPEALQYTAAAVPGPDLRAEASKLSASVSGGNSLAVALGERGMFPALLTAFVTCGERAGRLPEALEAAGRYAALQTDRYAERIRLILPLIVFIAVVFLEGCLYVAMLAPMIKLISSLTG